MKPARHTILVLHNRYRATGGEDRVVEAEVSLLERGGHRVLLVTDRVPDMPSVRTSAGIAVNAIWNRRLAGRVRRIIQAERVEVVHVHNFYPLFSPAVHRAASAQCAVVQTLHNFRIGCPAGTFFREGSVCELCLGHAFPWGAVAHSCYRGSRAESAVIGASLALHRMVGTWTKCVDQFIALTGFARDKFVAHGLPKDRIFTKPNFLFEDPGAGKHDAGFALFVGRLSAEKGVWTLLRAWEHLTDVPIKLVGDGPLMDDVRAWVASRGCGNVSILGPVERAEVLRLMQAARLLVVPSACYEGFPVALVEAFATATPVVAAGHGAMQEIIRHGYTGWLYRPPDSAVALASAVRALWTGTSALEQVSLHARAEFVAQYGAERNMELLLEAYRRALRAQSRRQASAEERKPSRWANPGDPEASGSLEAGHKRR